MSEKSNKPLSEQIETIITPDIVDAGNAPISPELLEHLEAFFAELNFETLPEYDLTTQEGALAAKEHSEKTLLKLHSKMAQIEVLKQALISAPLKADKIIK